MSKPTKSNKRNKRSRQKPIDRNKEGGTGNSAQAIHASSRQRTSPRQPAQSEYDRKRKLWDRKQAELEARWVAAKARETSEASARRRTRNIAGGVGGAVLLMALGALAYVRPGVFGLSGL